MDRFLLGQNAIVTGASKGIGYEIARALLEAGASVVLCGRHQADLDAAVSKLGALTSLSDLSSRHKISAIIADVSNYEQVETLFAFADRQLGRLDILVNNAGSGVFRPVGEMTIEEWDRVIGTNLSGAFYCSRAAVERFRKKEQKGGWIVNISSLAGRNPFAGGAAYNASKFGLNGLSEALMLDHRDENVKVSYIMPGSVDTGFDGKAVAEKSEWKIAPEDIAEIALDILRKPGRTLVSRVEVRPSRPPRK